MTEIPECINNINDINLNIGNNSTFRNSNGNLNKLNNFPLNTNTIKN